MKPLKKNQIRNARLDRLAAIAAVGPTTLLWMQASASQRHLRSRLRSESECASARRGARARVLGRGRLCFPPGGTFHLLTRPSGELSLGRFTASRCQAGFCACLSVRVHGPRIALGAWRVRCGFPAHNWYLCHLHVSGGARSPKLCFIPAGSHAIMSIFCRAAFSAFSFLFARFGPDVGRPLAGEHYAAAARCPASPRWAARPIYVFPCCCFFFLIGVYLRGAGISGPVTAIFALVLLVGGLCLPQSPFVLGTPATALCAHAPSAGGGEPPSFGRAALGRGT